MKRNKLGNKALVEKILQRTFILLLVFYAIYPSALSIRGSSTLFAYGAVGVLMYAYHRFPFYKDVTKVLLVYMCWVGVSFYSSYINNFYDTYTFSFTKSQMGWLFGAYIINFFLFKYHDKPKFETLVMYVVGAVLLQCIITVVMHFNSDISDFFLSIQLHTEIDEGTLNHFATERLVGYGTVLFGTGIVAGYGLILTAYVINKVKMTKLQLIIAVGVYAYIFYIGLFGARTTTVGFAMSIALSAFYIVFNPVGYQKQSVQTYVVLTIFLIIGFSLCYIYFPKYTDWAFELFSNFASKGELGTKSSNGLAEMTYFPDSLGDFIIGTGSLVFFGSDVGYTRLMFFNGLIGTVCYFVYFLALAWYSRTKDMAINALYITLFIYTLALNVKGLADVNVLYCLFFFFFQFYKREVLKPKIDYHNALIKTAPTL